MSLRHAFADAASAAASFPTMVGAAVYKATQNITPRNTFTLLTFDTVVYESPTTIFDAASSTSRLVAPEDGYYLVRLGGHWTPNTDGFLRQLLMRKNSGGSFSGGTNIGLLCGPALATAGQSTHQVLMGITHLSASEYVEAFASQDSVASLAMTMSEANSFSIAKLAVQ